MGMIDIDTSIYIYTYYIYIYLYLYILYIYTYGPYGCYVSVTIHTYLFEDWFGMGNPYRTCIIMILIVAKQRYRSMDNKILCCFLDAPPTPCICCSPCHGWPNAAIGHWPLNRSVTSGKVTYLQIYFTWEQPPPTDIPVKQEHPKFFRNPKRWRFVNCFYW